MWYDNPVFNSLLPALSVNIQQYSPSVSALYQMFYSWDYNTWPGTVINFGTIPFSPLWIQIPFTSGSRHRRTWRHPCACRRVSLKRRCNSGSRQTTSALEFRVSLLSWKASCLHLWTPRPAPGSSKMTKGLHPGKLNCSSITILVPPQNSLHLQSCLFILGSLSSCIKNKDHTV